MSEHTPSLGARLRPLVLLGLIVGGITVGFDSNKQQSYSLLLFVLFLMGCQSSLFGPVKYAYLPQQLHTDELVGGDLNAIREELRQRNEDSGN